MPDIPFLHSVWGQRPVKQSELSHKENVFVHSEAVLTVYFYYFFPADGMF